MDLSSLGFQVGGLCEVIITTVHADGTPNAAPIGVGLRDGGVFYCRVHRGTDTHANLLRSGKGIVNIVHDPLVFLRSALQGSNKGSSEHEHVETKLDDDFSLPFLIKSDAYIPFEVLDAVELTGSDEMGISQRTEFLLKPSLIRVLNPYPNVPNRGFNAALELAISLSRKKNIEIGTYLGIMKKTLPREEVEEIEAFILDYMRGLG